MFVNFVRLVVIYCNYKDPQAPHTNADSIPLASMRESDGKIVRRTRRQQRAGSNTQAAARGDMGTATRR